MTAYTKHGAWHVASLWHSHGWRKYISMRHAMEATALRASSPDSDLDLLSAHMPHMRGHLWNGVSHVEDAVVELPTH